MACGFGVGIRQKFGFECLCLLGFCFPGGVLRMVFLLILLFRCLCLDVFVFWFIV